MSQILTDDLKLALIKADQSGLSWRQISEHFDLRKSTVSDFLSKRTHKDWWQQIEGKVEKVKYEGPRIFIYDIETAPEVSYHFGRWKVNLTEDKNIQRGHMLTWAGKWYGEDTIYSDKLTNYNMFNEDPHNDVRIVETLWDMIDQADIIVAHNGIAFDTAWFRSRCMIHGLRPPSPFKEVDTLKEIRRGFRFPSNSLKSLMIDLDLERKIETGGFELWARCMRGEREAFETMQEYNIGDIVSLEELYIKLLPWIRNHPNAALYYDDNLTRCTGCGSDDLELIENRNSYTGVSVFAVHRCNSCGRVSRERKNILSKAKRESLLTNAL